MKKISIILFFMILAQSGKAQNLTPNEKVPDDRIYAVVDTPAAPEGGLRTYYNNFAKAFRTPVVADKDITQIKIMIAFVVEKDGSLTDFKILRNPGYGAAEEAIRVLKSMPSWTAGILEGNAVRCQFTLPITVRVR
jgi:protein TonB